MEVFIDEKWKTKLVKSGNSLGVTVPSFLVKKYELCDGKEVEMKMSFKWIDEEDSELDKEAWATIHAKFNQNKSEFQKHNIMFNDVHIVMGLKGLAAFENKKFEDILNEDDVPAEDRKKFGLINKILTRKK